MKTIEWIPPGVKEMIFLLKDQGFPVKKVAETNSNEYLIVAKGINKSRSYKLKIEFNEALGIVYFATKCLKPVPSKKYHFALELLNQLSLASIQTSYAICPKALRMTCFIAVSYQNTVSKIEMVDDEFLWGIWYGIGSLNRISKGIEKKMSIEDIIEDEFPSEKSAL